MSDTYIFTEMIRCGNIGSQAIKSFHKHHDVDLHIWCSQEDVFYIPTHKNNIIHVIETGSELYNDFDEGHKGTSHLWTNLILDLPDHIKKIIHFDSDVYFRGNMVDDIVEGLHFYELVGPVRPYKNNQNNRDDVRKYSDVVQTYCFGFHREFITKNNTLDLLINKENLWNWVRGHSTNFIHDVIDFFDPVSFLILYNGGKCKTIDENIIGGIKNNGLRDNKYGILNNDFDVGDKIIHFASVGSGLNFCKMIKRNKQIKVSPPYIKYAIIKYDIYSRIFFNTRLLDTTDTINNNEIVHKFKALISS